MKKLILAALLMLVPAAAHAEEPRPDRPHWSLELKGGVQFPDVAHWSHFYGSDHEAEFGGSLAYKIERHVEVGIEGSYSHASGQGALPQHGLLATGGEATFERAPLNVFVLARGVLKEKQWLVPYAGGGYTRMFYRSEISGQQSTEGSVNGYHVRGGLQLLLDNLENDAAESLYREYGLHHSYLFVEGRYIKADADKAPTGSVNLGGTSCLGGLLFEF